MNTVTRTSVIAILLLAMAPVQAAFSQSIYEHWQLKRLYEPARMQIMLEEKGRVFIYEGLTDKQISRVMDQQFGRLENMMFIGTVVTDEKGEPKNDPKTGLIMKEDDGC